AGSACQVISRPIMGTLSTAVAPLRKNVFGRLPVPLPVSCQPHGVTPPAPPVVRVGIHSDGPLQGRDVGVPATEIFRTSQYKPGSGRVRVRNPFPADVGDSFAPAPVVSENGVPLMFAGAW